MSLPDDDDEPDPSCRRRGCNHPFGDHINDRREDWHCVDCRCRLFLFSRRESVTFWFSKDFRAAVRAEVFNLRMLRKVIFALASYCLLIALPSTLFGLALTWVGAGQFVAGIGQLAMTMLLYWKMGRILQVVDYLITYQKEYAKAVDQPDDV